MVELITALLVFLFPLAYSPGPGNLFFAANGACFGLRATLSANAGYHVATWVVTIALGFGFAAVMNRFPLLLPILKWVGSLYVLYLAVMLFKAGASDDPSSARPVAVWDGVLLLTLNPKADVIIALMFSQFLTMTDAADIALVVLVSTVFTANNLIAFLAWTILGDRLACGFRDRRNARILNMGFGLMLAGVAVWMMVR